MLATIYTVTTIKGGSEVTTLGDRGRKFDDVIIVMESYTEYPIAEIEIRVPLDEQDQHKIGDLFKMERVGTSWSLERLS